MAGGGLTQMAHSSRAKRMRRVTGSDRGDYNRRGFQDVFGLFLSGEMDALGAARGGSDEASDLHSSEHDGGSPGDVADTGAAALQDGLVGDQVHGEDDGVSTSS